MKQSSIGLAETHAHVTLNLSQTPLVIDPVRTHKIFLTSRNSLLAIANPNPPRRRLLGPLEQQNVRQEQHEEDSARNY